MSSNDREIVASLRRRFADSIGADRFELWFDGRTAWSVEDGGLIVQADDPFTHERIKKLFLKQLRAAVETTLGDGARLDIRTTTPSEPAPSQNGRRRHRPANEAQEEPSAAPRGRRFATFQQFVAGKSNGLAYRGALDALQRPGLVSPLYIYGPHGSGKSHILEGMWSFASKRRSGGRAVYVTAEQFTTSFVDALRDGGLPMFRRLYRDTDMLLVDDVHFLAGKRATLVEFQQALDALQRSGAQIAMTSLYAPGDLDGFTADLVARMAAGLVCPIEHPDDEVRLGILQSLARERGIKAPPEVLQHAADLFPGDARRLSGALFQIDALSRVRGQRITKTLAEEALRDMAYAAQPAIGLPEIEKAVCQACGLEPKQLRSASKARVLSQPRALAMWLARKYTKAGLEEISRYFGRRSHSSVIEADKKVAKWRSEAAAIQLARGDRHIDDALRQIEGKLQTG